MTTATEPEGGLLSLLPARYSKFVAVLIGLFITYLTIYGWKWHLDPALVMIGTALGVYGVPNGRPPVQVVPVPVSETVTTAVIENPPVVTAPAYQDVPLPEVAPEVAPTPPAPDGPSPTAAVAEPPGGAPRKA